jgi:hypothetical protein
LQTDLAFKALIIEDLPTLGYPANPIEIFFLSLWKLSNYLITFIKDPLPKGLVMLALNATVGYSF